MRQRLALIITLIVVIGVLIALNAASYVKVEQTADSEESPDRSTFNSGATGTRALFDFLRESGYQVTRWRESTSSLLSFSGPKPAIMVIIGPTIVPFSKAETDEVLRWVANGGRLIVIDRTPDRRLLPKSGEWTVTTQVSSYPWSDLDPTNLEQMTSGVKPVAAAQPSLLTRGVETILPSQFAAAIEITATKRTSSDQKSDADHHAASKNTDDSADEPEDFATATPEPGRGSTNFPEERGKLSPAPAIHFTQERGGLLTDYPHGQGRIVFLSDPFIVANNGIGRADNLLLAINIVGGRGVIAFDEFHQGRAATHNALIQYFEGTPVLAICGQFALIGLAVIWSRGRRFARALPLPHVDRRSSLEFVASMAELQQRAKAHDLALENIYGRVHRVLVRHAGLSNSSSRAEIAARVAARSSDLNRQELESLMRNCEDTINGATTNARETLRMATRLREIESALGLRTRSREAKQATKD